MTFPEIRTRFPENHQKPEISQKMCGKIDDTR